MALNLDDVHVPSQFLIQVCSITQYELEQLGKEYNYARQNDRGYPLGSVCKALNAERKKMSDMMGTKLGSSESELKIEYALKQETVLAKRIVNQAKLGALIPKEEASERVKRIFNAVINMTRNAIKNSAPRLIGVKEKRDAETIMTEEWNDQVLLLKSEGKVISWEQDGTSTLLRTRLSKEVKEDDPELSDIIDSRIDNEKNKSLNLG